MYLLYISPPPIQSFTHLWLHCCNFFIPSKKKNVFVVLQIGEAKDLSTPYVCVFCKDMDSSGSGYRLVAGFSGRTRPHGVSYVSNDWLILLMQNISTWGWGSVIDVEVMVAAGTDDGKPFAIGCVPLLPQIHEICSLLLHDPWEGGGVEWTLFLSYRIASLYPVPL
jgi:hypothetical protein